MIPNLNTYAITYGGIMPFGGLQYIELWAETLKDAEREATEIAKRIYKQYLKFLSNNLKPGIDLNAWKSWEPDFKEIKLIATRQRDRIICPSSY